MRPRMPYDDACWEKSKEISDSWVQELAEMEELATRKLMDMESRVLAWEPDDSTLALLEPRKEV